MIRKSLGEILVESGAITAEQLVALNEQRGQEESDTYIRRHAPITDEQRAAALSIKFGLPLLTALSEKDVDPEMLAQIPLRFLRDTAVIPIRDERGGIRIVTSDPYEFAPIDELTLIVGTPTSRAIAPRSLIVDTINRYYPLEGTKEMIAELEEEKAIEGSELSFGDMQEDILGMESDAPIIKLVNHILYQAVKRGASDIHIEPFEKEVRVRFRIDGIMYEALTPPKRAQAAISSRLKIMANLNIAEKRQPQDGRIQIRVADKPIDIRVSVLPVTYGERIVMRLLDKSRSFASLEHLGLSERDQRVLNRAVHNPNGILLITGPTGSGKTSTLYSILSELNTPDVNIVTVEDPVEYQMAGIGQVQVREKIGLTFAAALRSILRQDPDIVMIGETRDQETAQIAIQAALTGHLVLSTLHTNSAPASITRLIDMGVEPFLIASTLIAIVAQRLVRRLCTACKAPITPDPAVFAQLGITPAEAATIHFYGARGCPECLNTGYKGRLALFEIMVMTPAIARLTIERADTILLTEQSKKDGMTQLVTDGVRKITAGLTTIEEVLSVAATGEAIDL
jgi:general secretion pathway protein E